MEVEWNAHRRELGAGIAATRAAMTKLHAERSAVPNGQDSICLRLDTLILLVLYLPPLLSLRQTHVNRLRQLTVRFRELFVFISFFLCTIFSPQAFCQGHEREGCGPASQGLDPRQTRP